MILAVYGSVCLAGSWGLSQRVSALVDDLDMSRAVVRTHNVRRMHLLASLL